MIRAARVTVTCSACGSVGRPSAPITAPGEYATQCQVCLAWLSFTVPESAFPAIEPAWYAAVNSQTRLPEERIRAPWRISPRWILAGCWVGICAALVIWAWR